MASSQRPLSPFMLGSYYRFQLTSVTSLLHRATGMVLALAVFGLAWWLHSVAAGPEALQRFHDCAGSGLGQLAIAGVVFSICYHFFNGLRHLLWDTGWGLELKQAYATGWAVIVLSIISTLALCAAAFGWLGGAA